MDKTTPKFSIQNFNGLIIKKKFLKDIYEISINAAPAEDWGILWGKPVSDLKNRELPDNMIQKYSKCVMITRVSEMPKKELGIKPWLDIQKGVEYYYMKNPGIDIFTDSVYEFIQKVQELSNNKQPGEKIIAIYHTHIWDFSTLSEKKIKNKKRVITEPENISLSEADKTQIKKSKRYFWPSYINEEPQQEGRFQTLGLGLCVLGIVYKGHFFIGENSKPTPTTINKKKFGYIGFRAYAAIPTYGIMGLEPTIKELKVLELD